MEGFLEEIRSEELAGGEILDEAAVGGKEFVFGQFFELHPLELVEDLVFEFTLKRGHLIKLKIDSAPVAIIVPDVGHVLTYGCADAQFLV